MGSIAATHARAQGSMAYAAVICSTLQQNQQLYLVRPVPSVCVGQSERLTGWRYLTPA